MMQMLDVYNRYPISLQKGSGMNLTDDTNKAYLDFYGGHGVISIGHSHPEFVKAVSKQVAQLAFYSNAFQNPLQDALATLLGSISGYRSYRLFLSNSGAEANENALKIASMLTGRKKILALTGAFHGRSAAAVAVTDNPEIRAPFGSQLQVEFIPMDDFESLRNHLTSFEYAAFILEGIQGVNGVFCASAEYWKLARLLCSQTGTVLIADEIQSGYGRSGKFFAHQYFNVAADIITVGKGMGNGFPVAGTIINPIFKINKGMLGTTFGGGQLSCAAAISVLKTFLNENLLSNALIQGNFLKHELEKISGVKEMRGKGLMLGVTFEVSAKLVRQSLLNEFGIITGFSEPETLRLLPPLTISNAECNLFIDALRKTVASLSKKNIPMASNINV